MKMKGTRGNEGEEDDNKQGWMTEVERVVMIRRKTIIEKIDKVWGRFVRTGSGSIDSMKKRAKDGMKEEVKKIWRRGEKEQCSRNRQKKGGEVGKTQESTTEETEREAKGDLNHNPLLNFTRSRFTKDPRAGPTSRAPPHTFNKLRALLCVFNVCVSNRRRGVENSELSGGPACHLTNWNTDVNLEHTTTHCIVLAEISSITKMKTRKQINRSSASSCISWSLTPFRASKEKQRRKRRKCNRKDTIYRKGRSNLIWAEWMKSRKGTTSCA